MSTIVQQARTYIGVRWKHRGRSRNGMDCAGLPWLVYSDLGDPRPDFADARGRLVYGRDPFNDGLIGALTRALGEPVWTGSKGAAPRSLLQLGDLLLMAPASLPRHVAIVGDDPLYGLSIIHADGTQDVSRVVEVGLSDKLLAQVVAVFRRGIA